MSRRGWQGLCLLFAAWALVATFWQLLAGRAGETESSEAEVIDELPPPEPERVLRAADFADLDGWREDDLGAALSAFATTCQRWQGRPDDRQVGPDGIAGTLADWRDACSAADKVGDGDSPRIFFESYFRPWQVLDGEVEGGLLTGYYEPTLQGSLEPSGRFAFPLYTRPPELVSVDLGRFRDDLAGRRLAGRVEGGRLLPYEDREALEAGALAGRGLELVWVDDPVDAFFLHIQGSGRVELQDGRALRVGYAAQNGHPYHAIGRSLIERGELDRETVSMQSIRRWLEENPQEAAALMAENRSFVFFRRLDEAGPVGSQGVVLTPQRSLAVDRTFLPLGAPVWLDGTAPSPRPDEPDRPLRRLLIAQDTGGAIRGPVRGDVFWGPGEEAAEIAGRMKHPARFWLFLPLPLDPLAAAEASNGGPE